MKAWDEFKEIDKSSVATVLRRMAEQCDESPEDAEVYAEEVGTMLDDLLAEDFFGTEGQCDPRGDRRN